MKSKSKTEQLQDKIKEFFKWSGLLDEEITKRLQHIKSNWELQWDFEEEQYIEEENSFSPELNKLFIEFSKYKPVKNYHLQEDKIVEFLNEKRNTKIKKEGKRWIVVDYGQTLEQGAFSDIEQYNLKQAAIGRIYAAIKRNQNNYDDMEESHRFILSEILLSILYHQEFD
jgi:hypothetical protein